VKRTIEGDLRDCFHFALSLMIAQAVALVSLKIEPDYELGE